VPISGSDFIIDANLVITALGQKPAMEIRDLPPGVFIGGDAAGGPATVINAIASGHESAQAMHRFISGEETSPRVKAKELEMAPPLLTAVRLIRAKARVLPLNARRGFEEIEAPFTPEEAMQEAKRCLRCGPCAECVRCSSTCPKHQVVLKLQDGVEPVLLRIHGLDRAFTERGCRGRVRIKVEALNEEIGAEVELLTVRVVKELCRGCARCAEVCPHEAISLRSWQGIEVATVDYERCRGCGNCLPGCPTGALQWLSQTESFTNV
jgi:Pyruvate/2-oxoacid:ferredoxin oxidoreductase delta subunit